MSTTSIISRLLCVLALFSTFQSLAQGPGGVNANLEFWFKANEGAEVSSGTAATDGQTIEFWRDQSGNVNDADQGDSGERPSWNSDVLNSNPGISFDGSTHLPISNLSYDLTTNTLSEFTIYSIVQSSQSGEGIVVSFDRSSFYRFALNHNSNANFGLSTDVGTDIDDFNASSAADDGQVHLIGADFSATSNVKNLFIDGVLDATRTSAHDPAGALLGDPAEVPRFGYIAANSEADAFDNSDNGNGINGTIGEIVYFEGILTPTERQQVESYLAIKYGITLSSDTDGDATAFEAGEGDYLAADGLTVVWDADLNSAYHNDIVAIAEDADAELSQASSSSVNASSILSVTDNGLSDNDYIILGHNGLSVSSALSPNSTFSKQLRRSWKVQVTGTTNDIDEIVFDLNSLTVQPELATDIALLIDDNESFSTPTEITGGTYVGGILTFSNILLSDLVSSSTSDIFITVAYNVLGPAGVDGNLALWYKADAGAEVSSGVSATDSQTIQYWTDQSGNDYDAQQNTAGERPVFDNSNSINFNPTITFDGTSSNLPITDLSYAGTSALDNVAVFVVFKSDFVGVEYNDNWSLLDFDRSHYFNVYLLGTGEFGMSYNASAVRDVEGTSSSNNDGNAHLGTAIYDNTIADETKLRVDGTEEYSMDLEATNQDIGNAETRFGYIGDGSEATTFNSNQNEFFYDGAIAEIIYYENETLSSTQIQQIESYLAIKYGITLSSSYLASSGSTIWDATLDASYNNMISVIGVDDVSTLNQTQSKSENASAILTLSNPTISDGDFLAIGNDGGIANLTASNTGSQEARIDRVWRVQRVGASVATLAFDLSTFTIVPDNASNYVLLIADDNTFTTNLQEITASSFTGGVATFDNVDLSSAVYVGLSLNPDLDNDLISDGNDLDDDNDGILDSDEGDGLVDTDGDGIVDSRDLDSDNDGIGDLYESGIEASGTTLAVLDANGDGIIDIGNIGLNGDSELVYTLSNIDAAVEPVILPDFRDLDSDQNGISDLAESGRGTGLDTDDDGIFEGTDTDQDGVPDEIDAEDDIFGSSELFAQDLDNDGTVDYRDNDNDGDLVEDVDEIGLTDTTPDDGFLDGSTDADGDGILADRDDDDAVYGQINIVDLLTGSGDDWYSFKTGDWNEPDNWTLDPSGTVRVNPNSLYPSSITDNVYVLNGDEMTLNFNSLIVSSVTVNDGGIIDLGMTTGHNFNVISGAGTIEVASDDFPSGDASDFISTSGGTVSYVDQSPVADYELTTVRTFNNMIVNLSANTVVLKADYTLNTDLTITSGTLQINDNTADGFTDNTNPLYVTVNGDFNIDASGFLTVGDVDASTQIDARGIYTFHQLELLGDFTNNGSAIFTNLSPTSIADGRYRDRYPTAADADNLVGTTIPSTEYGVVEMLFTDGTKDQLITLNGPTDFYRIEIAKGTSQTFTAEFNASATSNFRLLGRIAMDQSDDSDDTPNIDNNRALGLEAGILKLGDNIVIDQIADDDPNGTDASTQGGNRNYMIDLDAQLWIASNAVVTKENNWGIHPFGKLKVSDNGTLTFTGTGQRTILVDNQGVFEMTGGTVDITQYRNKTGADGAPRGSFVMTGGTMNIGGGDADGNHAIFSVPWEDQNFILNADNPAEPPVINITIAGNRGKDNAAIQVGVGSGNYNVGVSEINITHTVNRDYKISSTVPFYNLSYDNSGTNELIISDIIDADDDAPGSGGVLPDNNSTSIPTPAQFAQPLVITNDLTITDGRINANDLDVTIGNIFTIVDGGEYDPGANTTFFNGSSPIQQLLLNGTTPLVGGGFNNIEFSGDGTEKDFGGDLATPVVILGDLTIGTGVTLNDNGKTIQVNGDISNSGSHITDASSPGKIEVTGGAASHEIGGDGTGQFKILDLNDAINAISFTSDMEVDSVLNLIAGILDIGTNQLTISSTATIPIRDDVAGIANFDATRMIQTAGNASDGGLSVYVNETESVLFPIGVSGKYTPALADFPSFTVDGSDDGFVSIRPVDAALSTTNPTGDILSYYWKVDTLGIDNASIPLVTFQFTYDDTDTDTGAQLIDSDDYFAGKVLDASPYTRSSEGSEIIGTNIIAFDAAPFSLEKANYTAGEATRFTGDVTVYYSKGLASGLAGALAPTWNSTSTWTTSPTDLNSDLVIDENDWHRSENPNAASTPVAGDVVVIGYYPHEDQNTANRGRAHHVYVSNGTTRECAELIFTQMKDISGDPVQRDEDRFYAMRPSLLIGSGQLNADIVSGEGEFFVRQAQDPDFTVMDLGAFNDQDSSIFFYETSSGSLTTYVNSPDEVSNLIIGANDWGRNDHSVRFEKDIVTRKNFEILGDVNLELSTIATGDITIGADLIFFETPTSGGSGGGGEIRFPNTGNARTITVTGDIKMNNEDALISIPSPGVTPISHIMNVSGSIIQNTTTNGGLLFWTADTEDHINLNLLGSDSETYTRTSGGIPAFNNLTINKGTSASTTFQIDTDFTLHGDVSGSSKALTLQNGTLILNDAGIDITLSDGDSGGDFQIPTTAGLELQAGTARIASTGTGSGNGLRLDGKLTLSGGDLVLDGGSSADNYIEYGTGGSSEIEISAGNLVVGSQLRRNLLSDDGVINYSQTGGTAVFGVNTTPDDSRGVFEIINSGAANSSSFTLSGASTVFAIVGAQDTPLQGTFILDTDVDVNVSSDAIIDFGYNYNVSGAIAGVNVENAASEVYEINSAFSLPNVRIDNGNLNAPVVEIVVQDLTMTDNLEILNGGSLVSNNFNLTVNNGFTNNGVYTPGTNTTTFNGVSQTIGGTTATSFNNLVINPSTSLTLSNPVTVDGDLSILSGEFIDGGNQVSLLGDLTIVTESIGTGGISMDGSTPQEINATDGAAEIDVLRINNSQGVSLKDNGGVEVALTIDDNLAIDDGIFSIEDNRLILDHDVSVTSAVGFSASEMISINGVKKSDGVEREFLASTDAPAFTIPVGTPGKYTPVTLDVNASDDAGSILVKPINSIHPSATGLDALNYYWLVTTDPSSVANFTGDISFLYLETDANNVGQTESTWENNAARLISPNWSKPTSNLVDIGANTITFTNTDLSAGGVTTFDGEYTVGNDIPDLLATYISNSDNIWSNTASWDVDRDGDGLYDEVNGDDDPVNEIPQPGTIVIIDADDEITMSASTDNDQNIFSLQIDGILDVVDSDGHNFGDISGSGTLRISNATLPGGNYSNFFTTTAGILDLSGAISYTISPDFSSGIRGLVISGGGTKTLPSLAVNVGSGGININDGATLNNTTNNNDIVVAGDVNVNNGILLLGNTSASLIAENFTLTTGTFTSAGAPLNLSGDLNLSGGTFNSGSATHTLEGDFDYNSAATFNRNSGRITFDGATDQNIITNDATLEFHNLRANKSGGSLIVDANTTLNINNRLGMLSSSVINTEASAAVLRMVGLSTYATGTDGYVAGPLFKDMDDEDASFTFRLGKSSVYKPIIINPEDGSYVGTITWEAEYYDSDVELFSSAENTAIDVSSIETNADSDEQVDNVNQSEYWRVDSGGGSASLSSLTIDISGIGISADNINDQQLQVMVWDNANTEWDHLGGASSGTPSAANVVSSVALSFSERIITSGIETPVLLPVEFMSFEGEQIDNHILLKWKTATEINNDLFIIQRSTNQEDFTDIASEDGSGNSEEIRSYSYIDKQPVEGVNYYRIKQVDFDGKFDFSEIIRVEYNNTLTSASINIYPNPNQGDYVNVDLSGLREEETIDINLYDFAGRNYNLVQGAGDNDETLVINFQTQLKSGVYLLMIERNGVKTVKRLLVK